MKSDVAGVDVRGDRTNRPGPSGPIVPPAPIPLYPNPDPKPGQMVENWRERLCA